MNISLTFNVDGTEEEVFGAINSYGVAIQHMSPIIANKNTNKKKVTSTKKEKVEDGDIVIEVPKPEPKEELLTSGKRRCRSLRRQSLRRRSLQLSSLMIFRSLECHFLRITRRKFSRLSETLELRAWQSFLQINMRQYMKHLIRLEVKLWR